MSLHDVLRIRLLSKAGLSQTPSSPFNPTDFDKLKQTEWSSEFEQLMRNRLLMGALRYGTLEQKRKKKKQWDLLGALKSKAEGYARTGNTEYLVDAANYCLLAFELDKHPNKHFKALDDHSDHCKLKK